MAEPLDQWMMKGAHAGEASGGTAACAEAVGIMDSLHEQTLEYLNTREQFGTKLGKFQALQHRSVDMFVAFVFNP